MAKVINLLHFFFIFESYQATWLFVLRNFKEQIFKISPEKNKKVVLNIKSTLSFFEQQTHVSEMIL